MKARRVCSVLLILLLGSSIASAGDYMKQKRDKQGDTSVKGKVSMEENGNNYDFTVKVWTKQRGQLKTGRGNAIFIMYGEGDEVISVIKSKKYCSTGIRNERERYHAEDRRFRKNYYDKNVVSEAFVVFAEDKGGVPTDADELADWCKNVVGEKLRKLRDELKAGEETEGGNYILRKLR